MGELASVSATTLNQFALDFEGNYHRILKSIEISKSEGSKFRCGPELEICGYNCEDHFYESDTIQHSWEVLAKLLVDDVCQDILIDVGMPVMFKGVTYNCRVIFLNRKIYLIRPKMILCDDGNYRESRWFTNWTKKRHLEDFYLPQIISSAINQISVSFGDGLLQLEDTIIGFEICEELWNPQSTHIDQTLAGAEIIVNGSGSYTEIRKASYVTDLIKSASAKSGCAYVFSNLRGCDGERVYFNACSSVTLNGDILNIGDQYSLKDVEVFTGIFDLNAIRIYKNNIRSRCTTASQTESYPYVLIPWKICTNDRRLGPTQAIVNFQFCSPEEEISYSPALWLWDYLRRSPACGFFLPLSGGVDSSSVAIIVYAMCDHIINFIKKHPDSDVLGDVRKVLKNPDFIPQNSKQLTGQILTTCYMGSENSSLETRKRAYDLAKAIGSNHKEINISPVVEEFIQEATKSFDGKRPKFSGTKSENLALQNIQARSRMVFAYFFAQLTPWTQNKSGFLLVLGTANVDEAIRGYFTKYDCSSADINPIGGISKTDLKSFILYAAQKYNLAEVDEIVRAPPTAELKPLEDEQTDEQDMGMTYEELSYFGRLRKPMGCGPFSMAARLLHLWKDRHEPEEISRKVKHFYTSYAANRHKMTTLTPACHVENYSPEDHRYDLRPIFYPLDFTWQFRKIDELVTQVQSQNQQESEVD